MHNLAHQRKTKPEKMTFSLFYQFYTLQGLLVKDTKGHRYGYGYGPPVEKMYRCGTI